MSDPDALPTELDDFDRALLGSARSDAPARGAVTRAAAVLGIAAATAPVATAAAATATVTAIAERAAVLSVSKWTIIGALGVAGAGTGTVAYVGATRSAAPPAAVVAPASPGGAQQAARPKDEAGEPAPSPAAVAPPTSEATPAAPAPRDAVVPPAPTAKATVAVAPAATAPHAPVVAHASPAAAPVGAGTPPAPTAPPPAAAAAKPAAAGATGSVSIAEEVALVDRARHALKQGRAGEAFDTLSLYQSRWPNGVLATEVRVLRVEALLRLGQRASAVSDARAFIAVQPNSRYAARLRELFAPGELD